MAFDPIKQGATETFDPMAQGAVALEEPDELAERVEIFSPYFVSWEQIVSSPIHREMFLSPEENTSFQQIIDNAENPEEEKAKMASTLFFASQFGLSPKETFNNYDTVTEHIFNQRKMGAKKAAAEIAKYDLKRKSLWTTLKHAYRQAGVRMTNALAGVAQIEGEVSGAIQRKFWGYLGLEPPFDIAPKLAEWGRLMSKATKLYYDEHPEERHQILPYQGFWGTTRQYLERPENILQGALEAVPMLLEAYLGHITGTSVAKYVGAGTKFFPWLGRVIGLGGSITAENYTEARRQGTPVELALPQAILTGMGEGIIEEWTLGQKLKVFHGIAGRQAKKGIAQTATAILLGGGKSYARGTAEEWTQRLNSNFWNMVFTDPDQKLLEGVWEDAAAGGPIELLMTAGFASAGQAVQLTTPQKTARIETIRDAIEKSEHFTLEQKDEISAELEKAIELAKPTPIVAEKPPVRPAEAITPLKPTVSPKAEGKPLFIPLRTEYYDKFVSGEKQTEIREEGPRWNDKTVYVGRKVTISKGYGRADRLTGIVVKTWVEENSTNEDFVSIYGERKTARYIQIRLEAKEKEARPVAEAKPRPAIEKVVGLTKEQYIDKAVGTAYTAHRMYGKGEFDWEGKRKEAAKWFEQQLEAEPVPIVEKPTKPEVKPKPPTEPQMTKLRQKIHAVAAVKGLTKKALTELKAKHTGYRTLTGKVAVKKITTEQLESLLKAVQKARPKRVGYKQVVTKKTETKIQSLKENLIKKTAMTDADYTAILEKEVHGKEPIYKDAKHFITETEGKDIIKRMLDEAEVIRVTEGYEKAIRQNEEIGNQVRILDKRIAEKPKRDPYSLESMRHYNQQAEVKTGAPFYAMYMDLIDTHLDSIKTRTAVWKGLENTVGKKQFRTISGDEAALQRVSDYIAAQSALAKRPVMPMDITEAEVKLAKEIQTILKDYQLKVRVTKFFNFYFYNQPIPEHDRYRREITKAVDIFEGKGREDLIDYLKTQEWGVIRSGYEPLEVLTQKVRPYTTGATTVGKGHIKIRTDIEYHTQERNVLQRLASYMRQIDMLYNMSPKINAYIRLFDDNMGQFKNPNIVKENIETFLRNLKRYNIQGGMFERALSRMYSQAMRVIIMPSPVLSFRNLFQNAAFEHDKSILIDTRNKPLSNARIEYLETYVMQTRAMIEEYFMVSEKPLWGLRFLTKMIDRIKIYPHSDMANRHWSFWAKINQVDRALETKAIPEMMKEARFEDITELEQRRALAILARDGKEAMARYVTRVHVDDIHFLYERSQRSPAEMTPLGKVVGNLFLFPRAYGEKLAHAANKMLKGKTTQEQWRGLKILFNVIAGGLLVGAIYQKITHRKRNPYNPLEILAFRPGGLAWGSVEAVTEIYVNILSAAKGDSRALAALTVAIPRAADMFIPFYDYTLRGIEAATDQKNIDRKVLRQIRMMIDKEYHIRGGAYKVRRNALEKWQYFIAGAGVDQKETGPPTIKR